VQSYQDQLTVVGTPVYAAPGCKGGTYRSALVVSASCEGGSVEAVLRSLLSAGHRPLVLGANSVDSFSVCGIYACALLCFEKENASKL
jgi:hypothetical protein